MAYFTRVDILLVAVSTVEVEGPVDSITPAELGISKMCVKGISLPFRDLNFVDILNDCDNKPTVYRFNDLLEEYHMEVRIPNAFPVLSFCTIGEEVVVVNEHRIFSVSIGDRLGMAVVQNRDFEVTKN